MKTNELTISSIMSKRHGIFNENFTVIVQLGEKLKTCRNLNVLEDHLPFNF